MKHYTRLRKRSKTEDISQIMVQVHKKWKDKILKNPSIFFGGLDWVKILRERNAKIHKVKKEK